MPYIGFSYPPPYGDCGSYPEDAYEEDGNYYCFRPLTGIMVLIDTSDEEDQGEIVLFPSPYGDYGSYQHPLQMA